MNEGTVKDMSEYNRFLVACRNNQKVADNRFTKYTKWRKENFPLKHDQPRMGAGMPEFIHFSSETTGVLNAFLFSARIERYQYTPEDYVLAIADCIDKHIPRDSVDKINIYVDIRPKFGWPNVNVLNMLSILKTIAGVLTNYYPERLHSMYIFSTPAFASAIWSLIKPVLDSVVVSKIKLIPGYTDDRQPLPGALKKVMSESLQSELIRVRSALV